MSNGLLQMFVKHGNLHGTSSFIESTGVTCSDSVNHNQVQVLSIPVFLLTCSCLLREPSPITVTLCVLCSYSDFFSIVFLSNLFNYRFPYCIHLYTYFTQQVIVAQYMCWFLKAPNSPMFSSINYFIFML